MLAHPPHALTPRAPRRSLRAQQAEIADRRALLQQQQASVFDTVVGGKGRAQVGGRTGGRVWG